MKKTFTAIMLVLTLAGCAQSVTITPVPLKTPPVTPAETPTASVTTLDLQTYNNSAYGFNFSYPKAFSVVNAPNYTNLETSLVQVQINSEAYPKTNFNDAAFAVSVARAKSLNDCLTLTLPEGSDGFKTKKIINGQDFYQSSGGGAGTGNLYQSTIYRGFFNNQTCLELTEMIHTSNIGNYDPGTVREVDQTVVQKQLDQILMSFKMTP